MHSCIRHREWKQMVQNSIDTAWIGGTKTRLLFSLPFCFVAFAMTVKQPKMFLPRKKDPFDPSRWSRSVRMPCATAIVKETIGIARRWWDTYALQDKERPQKMRRGSQWRQGRRRRRKMVDRNGRLEDQIFRPFLNTPRTNSFLDWRLCDLTLLLRKLHVMQRIFGSCYTLWSTMSHGGGGQLKEEKRKKKDKLCLCWHLQRLPYHAFCCLIPHIHQGFSLFSYNWKQLEMRHHCHLTTLFWSLWYSLHSIGHHALFSTSQPTISPSGGHEHSRCSMMMTPWLLSWGNNASGSKIDTALYSRCFHTTHKYTT